MPTSSKKSSKQPAKRTTKKVSKPAPSPVEPPAGQVKSSEPAVRSATPSVKPSAAPVKPAALPARPFLRFYISDSLRIKTLAVLTGLEQAQDSTRHRGALTDLVLELADSGLDYYFLRPLKLARVGFVTEQSAHMGMGTVKRVMSPVIRNIIGHMDDDQLIVICNHIRQLME